MQAGKLRYLMTVEQRGQARTATGAVQEAWTTVATVWGGFTSLSGRELEAAQKIAAEANSKILIRYYPGIVPEMRINLLDRRTGSTRIFDILSSTDTDEIHKELTLLCREHDVKTSATVITPTSPGTTTLPYGRKSFTGVIDGINTLFTLPSIPDTTILQVVRNGAILTSPVDFTINGNAVTFVLAPKAASGSDPADIIFAYY